uniref:Uncharacterized protein n=1 Tax=Oryza glumipatula TaxID=40148 RepID=A0A0D9YP63_9ORYZ
MELRLPMQGGIEPPRPLELTLSAMTRSWVCVLLHETPCQLQKFWDVLVHELKAPASLSVSVSSLIANGREHEMMNIAKSGMSFGQGANKRIILLLVLWLAFAYGIFIAAAAAAHLAHGHALPPALTSSEGSPTVVVETLCHTSESPSSSTPVSSIHICKARFCNEPCLSNQ